MHIKTKPPAAQTPAQTLQASARRTTLPALIFTPHIPGMCVKKRVRPLQGAGFAQGATLARLTLFVKQDTIN